jgi:IS4 transposase
VTDFFQGLEPGGCGEVTLYYHVKGDYKPIRFCAIRKTEEGEEKGVERLKAKKRVKDRGKPSGEARLASNRYVMVMTSLLETGAELIPRLYRFRWRTELVFKRLKSLFGDNRIPSKAEVPAKAQVYGKLLLAVFCETGAHKARFSP